MKHNLVLNRCMRLVSAIIFLLAISIQSSIAQVTYEPDQITSKSKKNKEYKIKKNIVT